MAQLAAECECGRPVPVPANGNGPLVCPCGNRVVRPPLEEFRGRSLVLSAMTIERRVRRLIAAGELPPMAACARCGQASDIEEADLWLDCEKAQYRTTGGPIILIIPGFFWMISRAPERVEVRGHNTAVPVPLGLCPACTERLLYPRPRAAADLAAAAAIIALSALVGYYAWPVGVVVGLLGLAAVLWRRLQRGVRWQRDLKALLRKVPAYGQLLDRYPFATVVVPAKRTRGDSAP